jgi:hypothetical protein
MSKATAWHPAPYWGHQHSTEGRCPHVNGHRNTCREAAREVLQAYAKHPQLAGRGSMVHEPTTTAPHLDSIEYLSAGTKDYDIHAPRVVTRLPAPGSPQRAYWGCEKSRRIFPPLWRCSSASLILAIGKTAATGTVSAPPLCQCELRHLPSNI